MLSTICRNFFPRLYMQHGFLHFVIVNSGLNTRCEEKTFADFSNKVILYGRGGVR